ncbi:MAG: S-layer homology domain-containing protein [Nitriliruptoraceae bacterium]
MAQPARGIDRVCPPPAGAVVADPDLPDRGTTHAQAISCAARYGLVGGFQDGTYRPGETVTRGQAASAVAAWIGLATGFELELPEEPAFPDQGETHGDAIARLDAVGIVTGREDGSFGPGAPLTRGQFARIMVRGISYADLFRTDGPLPPVPAPEEVDLEDIEGSVFAEDIRALAGTGIATGVEPDRFAPNERITRGQLASLLMRAADYLDRHQRWEPTAEVVTFVTELELITEPDAEGAEEGDEPDTAQDPGDDEAAVRPASLPAVVVVNAFNGTIGYLVELSELDRSIPSTARLTLGLGSDREPGPVVVTLADADELEDARRAGGIASGTRVEADSSVRLADLLLTDASVVLQLEGTSQGTYRGILDDVG